MGYESKTSSPISAGETGWASRPKAWAWCSGAWCRSGGMARARGRGV